MNPNQITTPKDNTSKKVKGLIASPGATTKEDYVQTWIENPSKDYSGLVLDMEMEWVKDTSLRKVMTELLAMTKNGKILHLNSRSNVPNYQSKLF